MGVLRRQALAGLGVLGLAASLRPVWAAGEEIIRLNIPGPNLMPFFPLELIPVLGIDRELGVRLAIRHLPSGVLAAEDMLAGKQKIYMETLAMLDEAVLDLDFDGRILHASLGWARLCRRDDSVGMTLTTFVHGDDLDALLGQCELLRAARKNQTSMRLRLNVDANQEEWVEARFIGYRNAGGELVAIRGVIRDITQSYQHERQITHMALHDALTGLPNRVLLEDRFKVALQLAQRSGHCAAVCFIDIGNFKTVNDSLGHQIWEAGLAALREWKAAGHADLRIVINMSKRQLFIASLAEQMLDDVVRFGLQPSDIMLEVTESVALSDVEHAAARLEELRGADFSLAIDDFGIGYSSLSQLHDIPVDELKIDISFIRRLHEPKGLPMVQSIIQIARALGLQSVAEGVEDARTAEILRNLGVDVLQGYYFGMPMSRAEFMGWLSAGQPVKTPASA